MISQRCRHQGRGSVFNRCFTSSIDTCAAAWVTLAIPFLLLLCQDLLLILPQIADWYQYPPSGSSRCNQVDRACKQLVPALSVPSKRVESLQPSAATLNTKRPQSFSTLQAGRVAATAEIAALRAAKGTFQYPPSGSSRCNGANTSYQRLEKQLSVPSQRVESLQPIVPPFPLILAWTFST